MPRYLAVAEYDGRAYCGFQRQRTGQPTIQGEIEQALTKLTNQFISVTGAGRTDSGVHATGQVISFESDWTHGAIALQQAINAMLPDDIAVLQLKQVSSSFHPRYDAQKRAYEYRIYNTAVPSPICRHYSWYIRKPLNRERMNEAARSLLGRHDFSTFGTPPKGDNCVREVYKAVWEKREEMLLFSIEANAFLYRMVRSIVGSLKLVGDGTWSVETFAEAFRACDRNRSGSAAPAHGLYLVSITYDNLLVGE